MATNKLPFYCRASKGFGYIVTKAQRLAEIEQAEAEVAFFDDLLKLVKSGLALPSVVNRFAASVVLDADRELAAALGFSRLEILAANYHYDDDFDLDVGSLERWTRSRRRRLFVLGGEVLDRMAGLPYWGEGDLESLRKWRRKAVAARSRARRAIADGRAR